MDHPVIASLRSRLEQEKGRHSQVVGDLSSTRSRLQELQASRLDIEQAQLVIQVVAQETQARLSWFLNDMVTAAIEAIFPDDSFSFFLEFVPRRGWSGKRRAQDQAGHPAGEVSLSSTLSTSRAIDPCRNHAKGWRRRKPGSRDP